MDDAPSAMRTTKRTANRARARDRLDQVGGGRMRTASGLAQGVLHRTLPRARAYGASTCEIQGPDQRRAGCGPSVPAIRTALICSLVVGAPCGPANAYGGLDGVRPLLDTRTRPAPRRGTSRSRRSRPVGWRPTPRRITTAPAGPPRPHRSRRRSRPRSSAVRPGAYRQAPRWSIRAREFLGPSLVAWLRYFVADLRDPFFSQRGRFRALLPNLILHVLRSLAQPAMALGSALAVERVRDGNTGGRRRGDTSQDENPRGRRRTGRPAGRVLSPLANGLGGLSRRFLCVSGRATGILPACCRGSRASPRTRARSRRRRRPASGSRRNIARPPSMAAMTAGLIFPPP